MDRIINRVDSQIYLPTFRHISNHVSPLPGLSLLISPVPRPDGLGYRYDGPSALRKVLVHGPI